MIWQPISILVKANTINNFLACVTCLKVKRRTNDQLKCSLFFQVKNQIWGALNPKDGKVTRSSNRQSKKHNLTLLDGALDAVERQVRERRKQQRNY